MSKRDQVTATQPASTSKIEINPRLNAIGKRSLRIQAQNERSEEQVAKNDKNNNKILKKVGNAQKKESSPTEVQNKSKEKSTKTAHKRKPAKADISLTPLLKETKAPRAKANKRNVRVLSTHYSDAFCDEKPILNKSGNRSPTLLQSETIPSIYAALQHPQTLPHNLDKDEVIKMKLETPEEIVNTDETNYSSPMKSVAVDGDNFLAFLLSESATKDAGVQCKLTNFQTHEIGVNTTSVYGDLFTCNSPFDQNFFNELSNRLPMPRQIFDEFFYGLCMENNINFEENRSADEDNASVLVDVAGLDDFSYDDSDMSAIADEDESDNKSSSSKLTIEATPPQNSSNAGSNERRQTQ